MTKTTFSWRNYTRATPRNLLRFSEFIQGTLLGVSTLSIVMEAHPFVPIAVNLLIVFVNRLVMFFGSVVNDDQTEHAVAEFPSGDQVELIKEKL